MWLSVMILAVLTITSCSSDELFDFYEIPNEDYNNILNCEKYSEYLDWDFTGNLVDASDQEMEIYFLAKERCNYYPINGILKTNYKYGYEINISERLFIYIEECVNELNRSNLLSKKRAISRVKSSTVEGYDIIYNGLNCPCFSLAYVKSLRNGISYDADLRIAVNNALTNEFGDLYISGGLTSGNIPRAAEVCSISGGLSYENGTISTGTDINGIWTEHSGYDEEGNPVGHMFVFLKIKKRIISNKYYMYWADPSTNCFNPDPIQVDGNSFPIKRVQSNLNISSIYK